MTLLRCLTLALAAGACVGERDATRDTLPDTLAPIGAGTELLLTRERLSLIDGWIRASVAREGRAPESLESVEPPEDEAALYVPLERYRRDGWGRAIEYEYVATTGSYRLRSPGEDGRLGTTDDVTLDGEASRSAGRR